MIRYSIETQSDQVVRKGCRTLRAGHSGGITP